MHGLLNIIIREIFSWFPLGKKGSFDDPFEMFALVHRITDNPWAVGEATRDVIREFAEDGVVYLELRTTPRFMFFHGFFIVIYSCQLSGFL